MLSSSNIALPETPVFKTALVSVNAVSVLFVRVSVASNSETVPVKFNISDCSINTRSATTKVVSFASSTQKTIFVSKTEVPALSNDFCIHRCNILLYQLKNVIVPVALCKSTISPTSAAVELYVVLNVSKVSVTATVLSAISIFIYPNAIALAI